MDFGKNDNIDFHHVAVLGTLCVILPPAPSVLQEDSSDAWVYTRGSVRRASGFVLTGKSGAIHLATLHSDRRLTHPPNAMGCPAYRTCHRFFRPCTPATLYQPEKASTLEPCAH